MLELPVNSLDYPDIRKNLITFLQQQVGPDGFPIYQDYDFQASGIATLINLLSYNTHYLGYYAKMLLNEAFIDSAVKIESLYSKAKLTGYVPKGFTASRAEIKLQIDIDLSAPGQYEPISRTIMIPKGTSFSGSNHVQDQRIFFTIDDTFITDIDYVTAPGKARYTSSTMVIYEGRWSEWKFRIDNTLLNQRYIIKDKQVDISTVRVLVIPDGSVDGQEYFLASNFIEVTENSPVYYLSTQEDGNFEIIFSNNVFGKMPENRSIVLVHYISTKGESGNGCKKFIFNAPSQDIPTEMNIGNWEDFKVLNPSNEVSSGGVDPETVDSLRFAIPHHYRRQNRIVTEDDYKAVILSEFRNIDSINIWGGENNITRDYGKIYISIKPKFSDKLTSTAKRDIENRLLTKYCVIGMQPVFVDPEFLNVEYTVYAKVESSQTAKSFGEIEKIITDVILDYNRNQLNVFNNFLSDVDLLQHIRIACPYLKSIYSKRTFNKDQEIIYASGIENRMYLGNAIEKGVESTPFFYGADVCIMKDDAIGNIYIYKNSNKKQLLPKIFGHVDYSNGILFYEFPIHGTMVQHNFGTTGIFTFSMTPSNPDIETYLQNIVRITKIRVVFTNA